jgi:lipid-A-disaccharide synthase
LGPFLKVVDEVAQTLPDVRFVLAASPFVSAARLADAAAKPLSFGLSTATASLDGDFLRTEAGTEVEVVWGDPYEVIHRCDLALSLPGTNTAELAIAGKPTVVPLSYRVPVAGGGLLGVIDRLPGLTTLKRSLRERKRRKVGLVALPNQVAGRVVMPEFFVEDDLSDLSEFVIRMLSQPERRLEIGREARDVMGPEGASETFTDLVEQAVDGLTIRTP